MKKFIFAITSLFCLFYFISCKSTEQKENGDSKDITPQTSVEKKAIDEEFTRSTQDVNISIEDFNADKKAILTIIKELSIIMTDYDFDSWLNYIEPESIAYWSNPNNLRNASKRLPIKSMKLNNLNDYFRMVFVPSRKGRMVDEIRYNSLDSVKAVQMTDNQDIVYYNFIKINGKWMVKIPAL